MGKRHEGIALSYGWGGVSPYDMSEQVINEANDVSRIENGVPVKDKADMRAAVLEMQPGDSKIFILAEDAQWVDNPHPAVESEVDKLSNEYADALKFAFGSYYRVLVQSSPSGQIVYVAVENK